MSAIRVMIVEDEPVIAADIAGALAKIDCHVLSVNYNAAEAVQVLESDRPDIALLDINLNGGTEGIELAHLINKKFRIPFIYLTSYSDKKTLELAKDTQPAGYIVKPFSENGLYASLEIALHNYSVKYKQLCPRLDHAKINACLDQPLTSREFEVLRMIYDGMANHQMAALLFVSLNTVKTHVNNAYLKLKVNSRATAINRLRSLMLHEHRQKS